jgi:hypothetical protein
METLGNKFETRMETLGNKFETRMDKVEEKMEGSTQLMQQIAWKLGIKE